MTQNANNRCKAEVMLIKNYVLQAREIQKGGVVIFMLAKHFSHNILRLFSFLTKNERKNVAVELTELIDFNQRQVEELENVSEKQDTQNEYPIDLYCTVDEIREAQRHTIPLNLIQTEEIEDAFQEITISRPRQVAQRIAQWEQRLLEKRTSQIFQCLKDQRKEAAKQAEEAEYQQENLWREQEKRAKEAEFQIREIARRAREEHRKTLLESDSDKEPLQQETVNISVVPFVRKNVAVELTELIDFNQRQVEELENVSEKQDTQNEYPIDLYCTVDEIREAQRHTIPLNLIQTEEIEDAFQEITISRPRQVAQRIAQWEQRLLEKRTSQIFQCLKDQRKEAAKQAEEAEYQQENLWREQEKRAKEAEFQIREIARRAREEHRKTLLESDSDKEPLQQETVNISVVPFVRKNVAVELTELIDFNQRQVEELENVSEKQDTQNEYPIDLYCTVDEIREAQRHTIPLNLIQTEEIEDAFQEITISRPRQVAQRIAQWEQRLLEKRTSQIFQCLKDQRKEAAKQAEEAEYQQENLWREQEKRAKEAEFQIREIARRAREEHRKTLLESDSDKEPLQQETVNISVVPFVRKNVAVELTELIDFNQRQVEELENVSEKQDTQNEYPIDLYCTVDEIREAQRHTIPLNLIQTEEIEDAFQEITISRPRQVAQRIAQWEQRLLEKRTSQIFQCLKDQRKEAAKQAEEAEYQQENLWREQEKRAKEAEFQIREIARRAREEHRKTLLESDSDKEPLQQETVNISVVPFVSCENESLCSLELSKPSSKIAIIEWFHKREIPRRAGLDHRNQVESWFHGLITRAEAEILMDEKPSGTFLVRISEKIWGYAITYRENGKCKHYLVEASNNYYKFLGANHVCHNTLGELVNYHRKKPITSTGGEILSYECHRSSTPAIYLGVPGILG